MTAVGAGSLVGFPLLVSVGLTPLVANVRHNVGPVPGGVSGAFGFRRELVGHRHLVVRVAVGLIAIGSVVDGWLGAHFGRRLPPALFRALVVVFGYIEGIKLLLG